VVTGTYLPFLWWPISPRTVVQPCRVPQVVPHSAKIFQPGLEQWQIPLALGTQTNIAIEEADDLVQEEGLGSG
jgi:hypothetical protein